MIQLSYQMQLQTVELTLAAATNQWESMKWM